MLARNDRLTIRQNAAAEIKRGTREGDSVALLGIARARRLGRQLGELGREDGQLG